MYADLLVDADGGHCAARGPVVALSGRGPGRISIAGLICLKPWHRGRLMWHTKLHWAAPSDLVA